MGIHSNSDFEVVKACFQLEQYLRALKIPLTVRQLYEQTYSGRIGIEYDPTFLIGLDDDENLETAKDESYTTQTIIETLIKFGHEQLVRALFRETRKMNIGYAQAYVMGFQHRKPEENDSFGDS